MKLTRAQSDQVEALALQMYDQYNVEPYDRVKVSKSECIKQARKKLFPRQPKSKE